MSVETAPGTRLLGIAARSVLVSSSLALVLGLLASPVLFALVGTGPRTGGYAVLALLGWGVFLGEEFGTDERGGTAMVDDRWHVRIGVTLVAILYYNVVLLVAVVLALAAESAVAPGAAVLVALGYPAYDARSVGWGVPVSVAGLLVGALVLVGAGLRVAASPDWREVDPARSVFRFFEPYRREPN